MQTFELYGTAWFLYIALGLILLVMVAYALRKSTFNTKFAVISFIAVGAFTPDLVIDGDTLAPLVITALLKAEVEGSSSIVSALIKLFALWGIIFFGVLGFHHYRKTQLQNRKNSSKEPSS